MKTSAGFAVKATDDEKARPSFETRSVDAGAGATRLVSMHRDSILRVGYTDAFSHPTHPGGGCRHTFPLSKTREALTMAQREQVDARNGLEQYCYNVRNTLSSSDELKDKIGEEDAQTIVTTVDEALVHLRKWPF